MKSRLSRDEAKKRYGRLYAEVEAIFFRHDPVGLNFGENTDEYGSEVSTILPRLKEAKSAEDVATIVHAVFVEWFSVGDAGPPDRYKDASSEIWAAWLRFENHKTDQKSVAKKT